MGNLMIDHYVVGPVQTNCFFAINKETKEMLVIDPGDYAKKLIEKAKGDGYHPVAVLLTHGHFDHAGGAEEFAKHFAIPIYAHEEEKEVLEDARNNASWMLGENLTFHADVYVKDEQELDLAGMHIRVLHTPGHTKGGCCYYLPYEDVVFSGDSLFYESIGRTDLPTGSASTLIRSVKEKLMTLPDRVAVYPGHGDMTTIDTERMYNPYL